uniref:U3 small nucleolar RNA-interacting protein 2-like n=1 Tax=Hirondellea gigas TaxID=1518452 RepID=A0A2P2I4A6_9CRUS
MPFFKSSGPSKAKEQRARKQVKTVPSAKRKISSVDRRLATTLSREEVESSSDDEEVKRWKASQEDDDQHVEDVETAQETKERLAKEFIQELQDHRVQQIEDTVDDVSVQQRLREEVLESEGRLHRKVARQYSTAAENHTTQILRCKKFQWKPITCIAINHTDNSIFSASLTGCIVKYSESGERLGVIKSSHQDPDHTTPRHCKEVLALAVTSDGKYLVSGDGAGLIYVWDAVSLEHITVLKKHRGAVTGLVFQRNSHNLYSCSSDRLVMEWNLEDMAFVDNLGGHSCGVQAVDALYRQSCISCAGADQNVIIYSILEDKQFQFTSKQISIDGVKLLNENTFLTYGQDGSVCLWSTSKKRPIQQLKVVHGNRKSGAKEPHWITALATLVNTDLAATGSSDGLIRLWRVNSAGGGRLHALARIPIPVGVVNSLEFTADGSALVVALACSHKHGRWYVEKTAKNCVLIIKFTGIKIKAPVTRSLVQGDENGEEMSEDEDSEDKLQTYDNGA